MAVYLEPKRTVMNVYLEPKRTLMNVYLEPKRTLMNVYLEPKRARLIPPSNERIMIYVRQVRLNKKRILKCYQTI